MSLAAGHTPLDEPGIGTSIVVRWAVVAPAGELPSELDQLIRSRMRRGGLVLFTGAGFSRGALAQDGKPVVSSGELKSLLWPYAFPGEPEDGDSKLADVFDCAMSQTGSRLRDLLDHALRIQDSSLPDYYRVWFSMPWRRVYTLNLDDLDEAVARRFELPRPFLPLSYKDAVPVNQDKVWSVHLNGRLHDVPDVTFSPMQYGARLPGRDPWYATLTADLMENSFIFVGTNLDEPPLWEHLELRGQRPSGHELRPRSFLITPHLPRARALMLRQFNVTHIAMDSEEFAAVLAGMQSEAEDGRQALTKRVGHSTPAQIVRSVSELRAERKPDLDLGLYLLGREPEWRDVTEGYAIERSFEREFLGDPALLEPRIVLVTGTAGTGKSTALRRLALSLEADGKSVGWIDQTIVEAGIPRIRAAALDTGFEYVFVDDVDMFGDQAGPFLRSFAEASDAPRVVAAARSTRAERFEIWERIKSLDSSLVVAPSLTDDDIDGLLDALDDAGLLGQLAAKSRAAQRSVFLQLSGRQLLVAMIEATSGQRFEERVADECSQLPPAQALIYAICALASRHGLWVSTEEVLNATGEASAEQLRFIDSLKRQRLLVDAGYGGLAVRHRVIAEQAATWFRREGKLVEPIKGLVFAMAIQCARDPNRSSRAFRILIRLLNHRFLMAEVGDRSDVRQIYEAVASVLRDNFHYWLQRGAFETQTGDLALAENFLSQARAFEPDDFRVRTEWNLLSLKRAAEFAQAGRSGWRERADEAMTDLRDVIEARGGRDPYPFHVFGSQGLHYVRRAPLTTTELTQTLETMRRVVRRGCTLHPDQEDLKQLRDDIEREYLSLAATDASPKS
jgi:hypothetical protein